MNIVFHVVDGFALVFAAEFLGADAAILDVAVHRDVASALISNGFEEGGASRAGTANDEHHLARFREPLKSRRSLRPVGFLIAIMILKMGPKKVLITASGKVRMLRAIESLPRTSRLVQETPMCLDFIPAWEFSD